MKGQLDNYHFYKREWESYDELYDEFEWDVPKHFNIANYVCNRWSSERGKVAIYYENPITKQATTYTFSDMNRVTNQLANYLRDNDVSRGDRVAINSPQRPETIFSHIACWKLGAVSVPMSTLFGPDAIEYRLNDCEAIGGIVDQSNISDFRASLDNVDNLQFTLTIGNVDHRDSEQDFWDTLDDYSHNFSTVETESEEDCILIYTSGTTGNPKGVRHAHRVLLGHLPKAITSYFNLQVLDSDVFWTPAEWAWIAALFNVVLSGLYFGKPVVAHNRRKFKSEAAFEIIDKYDVSIFFGPPTALRKMMQVDAMEQYNVESLRTINAGGESLGQNVVDWAEDTFGGAVVHEGYGQTEANMLVGDCRKLLPFKEGYIGKPAPGHEVCIVDPDTAEPINNPGEVGEIAVRYEGNPVCFKEYWGKPEATEAKVQNGWLLTEDLGRMDEDGYVAFESRKDDVIISAGYRIGPVEIEETILSHESVADVAVIGIPDDERGEVPKAFVVLNDGYKPSKQLQSVLKDHVRNQLAQYEYPREIEFIDELPKTSTGKIRRASLKEN